MPKDDCKYWEQCYQRNEQHLQKYNHPEKSTQQEQDKEKTSPKKRKLSKDQREKTPEEMPSSSDKTQTVEEKQPPFETDDLKKEALNNIAGKNWMEMLQKRIKLSEQDEYNSLLKTNEFIRHKFLVEMPDDFYAFWKFLSELKSNLTDGEQILQHVEKQFQLQLVGAFEFLGGRFTDAKLREPGDYLRHWRFFYDPAEFQTIFVRKDTGIHYGYWRDQPHDKEHLLIARNDGKSCEFEFIAGNAFDAFLYYLEKDFVATPFSAASVASCKKALHSFIEMNQVDLAKLETLRKARNSKVVTKTFHRAGIVVPFDRKTELGYRPLIVSDTELKKIIKLFETAAGKEEDKDDSIKKAVIEKLQPIATAASIALDECDFGTSLELGIDLFCSGRLELHMLVQSLLVPAYTLLQRPQFIAISKAHMEQRSKSLNLSIFDLDK